MPSSPWIRYGALVAVGLAVAASAIFIPLLYQHQKHASYRQEAAAAYQERAADKARDTCAGAVGFVDRMNCIARETQANQRDEYTHYDLTAQQNMSLWALGLLIVSIEGLLVTIAGVVFVAWTLRAAIQANKLSREAIVADQRAWMVTELTVEKVESDDDGVWFDLAAINTNIGKTPAIDAHTTIEAVLSDPGGALLKLAEASKYDSRGTRVVIPQETYRRPWIVDVDRNEARKQSYTGKDFVPYIIVCITYKILGDDQPHQSGFVFHINLGEDGHITVFLPTNDDILSVTADQIAVSPWSGGFAT